MNVSAKASFELECDESDLDLLILRLTAAKARLIKIREEGVTGNTDDV